MEIVTLQSEVWQSLLSQLRTISLSLSEKNLPDYDNLWLDESDTREYLGLSSRTLARMRKRGEIAYAKLHGKYFYTIGEIKRTLDNRKTGTTADYLEVLARKGREIAEKGRRMKSAADERATKR